MLTHSRQSHLRLSNATVLPCCSRADPIAQRACSSETDQSAGEDREVHEADALAVEVVWRRREVLALSKIDGEERAA